MKDEDFAGLVAGMTDVLNFQRGEAKGFVVHTAQNIKAIRSRTGLSQPAFAQAFGLEVASLRDWEQGRRQPERSAQVLLSLIDKEPDTIRRLLSAA